VKWGCDPEAGDAHTAVQVSKLKSGTKNIVV